MEELKNIYNYYVEIYLKAGFYEALEKTYKKYNPADILRMRKKYNVINSRFTGVNTK